VGQIGGRQIGRKLGHGPKRGLVDNNPPNAPPGQFVQIGRITDSSRHFFRLDVSVVFEPEETVSFVFRQKPPQRAIRPVENRRRHNRAFMSELKVAVTSEKQAVGGYVENSLGTRLSGQSDMERGNFGQAEE
jgi:hypothetical protein